MSEEDSYADIRRRNIDDNNKRMDALNLKLLKNRLNDKPPTKQVYKRKSVKVVSNVPI